MGRNDSRMPEPSIQHHQRRLVPLGDPVAAYRRILEIDVAAPLQMSLTETMADKEPLWNSMVDRYDLAPTAYADVAAWPFGDFVFGWDYDFFSDGSKARRLGFHRYVETEKMFTDIFSDLRRRRVIP